MKREQGVTKRITSLVAPLLLVVPGCYAGLEDGRPIEGLEDRGGATPGRWLMTEPVADVSRDVNVQIDGSPAGAHQASNCTGTFLPGAQVLRQYLRDNFEGVISIGGYNCRPINHDPSMQTSVHGLRRALDIHVTCAGCEADNETGDPVAHWLIEHAEEIGVQRIIWDASHWKAQGLEQTLTYGGGHPHNDHLHVELNLEGAYALTPWFAGAGPDIPPVPEPETPPEPPPPPPQDGCPDPCWPDMELGTHCGGGERLVVCADHDGDGCTELREVDSCNAGAQCHGNPGDALCCAGSFCDDEGSSLEGDIDYIADAGITEGCGTGVSGEPLYCPSDAGTRAMVITMLGRATGMPTMADPDAFDDDDGHWAEGYINAARYYGITNGISETEFGPQLEATRTQTAAFIVRTYGLAEATADHFDDDDEMSSWKQDAHNRLYEAGLTNGCGPRRFCGDDTVTREQLAAFIARAHQSQPLPTW